MTKKTKQATRREAILALELEQVQRERDAAIRVVDEKNRELTALVGRDYRRIAEMVITEFWLSQARRVAVYALANGIACSVHPPLEEQIKRATEQLTATLDPREFERQKAELAKTLTTR